MTTTRFKKNKKRSHGQYFTKGNPFLLDPFQEWIKKNKLSKKILLEPFAGANDIITMLNSMGLCKKFTAYDIYPANKKVKKRDTIKNFPKDYKLCITNPPWLARNSATRMGFSFPITPYDDLYKHCLNLCLKNCEYVGAIIPASFLNSGIFRERLSSYILLHKTLFQDTENPVCLALFNKKESKEVKVYNDNEFLGDLTKLEEALPKERTNRKVKFNDPNGNLGFISFDSTKEPSIRFCDIDEIKDYEIKISSRFITRISGEFNNISNLQKNLNRRIRKFRNETKDIFLTPFKGIRKDGWYRRRMHFSLARKFINEARL